MPSSRARKTASLSTPPAPDAPLLDDMPPPGKQAPRRAAVAKSSEAANDSAGAKKARKTAGAATVKKAAEPTPPAARKRARKTAIKTAPETPPEVPLDTVSTPVSEMPAVPLAPPARTRAAPRKRAKAEAVTPPSVDEAVDPDQVDAAALPVEPLLPAVPPRTWSELRLEPDACGRRLVWQAGEGCPEALRDLAASMMGDDGDLGPQHDEALMTLQALADRHAHELRIDPALWHALAVARDVRWRVHHLEQAYPEGTASPALRALWPDAAGRLAPFHYEGALFAACAGRCLLADEAALEPVPQALLAVQLFVRHFGVQRVLVVCPHEALPHWQRARLQAGLDDTVQVRLAASVPADGWSPELVIVDDTVGWRDASVPVAVRAVACAYALVLMHEPAERPQSLADWLAWLDHDGVGASRQFLRRHRAEAPPGWVGLDRLRDTLGAVMLRRTRSRWLQPVPGRRDRLVWLPVGDAERAAQADALRRLQPVLDRWQRVQYVSDVEQLAVQAVLHDLRVAAAPDAQQRIEAVQRLWAEVSAPGVGMAVAAGSPAQAQRLTDALLTAGLPARREADAVLLGQAGPADAPPTQWWHVCAALPWPAATPPRSSHAPVTYLLTDGGIDEHRLVLQCRDPATDAALADPALFRQGSALAQRMAALAALVDRLQHATLRDAH